MRIIGWPSSWGSTVSTPSATLTISAVKDEKKIPRRKMAEYGRMELGHRIYPYAVTSRASKEPGLSEIHQFHNMYGEVFSSR